MAGGFFKFVDLSDKTLGYKTKLFAIEVIESGERVGMIKWHDRFKEYGFFPHRNLIFDALALQSITDFMREQNKLINP